MNTSRAASNHIISFIHCQRCLNEKPRDTSPKEYARFEVGFTDGGRIQVWCNRHDCNVIIFEADDLIMPQIPTCGHVEEEENHGGH